MSTRVYVQNHTSLDFPIGRTSLRNPPRHPLPPTSFEWYTARIPAMTRRKLLEFDRASHVRNGESYEFRSPLKLQDTAIELRQRMRGTLLHSKLWCSAGGDPWFDDEQWLTIIWRTPRGPVEIVYRSYGTGGDNDIEYIINPAFAPNPVQDTFNVLAYNVYTPISQMRRPAADARR